MSVTKLIWGNYITPAEFMIVCREAKCVHVHILQKTTFAELIVSLKKMTLLLNYQQNYQQNIIGYMTIFLYIIIKIITLVIIINNNNIVVVVIYKNKKFTF